jgi:hypothetical protein
MRENGNVQIPLQPSILILGPGRTLLKKLEMRAVLVPEQAIAQLLWTLVCMSGVGVMVTEKHGTIRSVV